MEHPSSHTHQEMIFQKWKECVPVQLKILQKIMEQMTIQVCILIHSLHLLTQNYAYKNISLTGFCIVNVWPDIASFIQFYIFKPQLTCYEECTALHMNIYMHTHTNIYEVHYLLHLHVLFLVDSHRGFSLFSLDFSRLKFLLLQNKLPVSYM